MISYIVSAFNRPSYLNVCLGSLKLQKHTADIWVVDNANAQDVIDEQTEICRRYGVNRVTVEKNWDCYWASEEVVERVAGEWICFPSDDSYYVPLFADISLTAARENGWDFTYFNCVYDPRMGGRYSIMETAPQVGHIDKTTFILKKSWFEGFPGKPPTPGGSCADGLLAESLVQRGIRHGKAPGVLCVHN